MNKQDNVMNAFPEIERLPPESAPANLPFKGWIENAQEQLNLEHKATRALAGRANRHRFAPIHCATRALATAWQCR